MHEIILVYAERLNKDIKQSSERKECRLPPLRANDTLATNERRELTDSATNHDKTYKTITGYMYNTRCKAEEY